MYIGSASTTTAGARICWKQHKAGCSMRLRHDVQDIVKRKVDKGSSTASHERTQTMMPLCAAVTHAASSW
jgi:hypothetical protein